MEEPQTEESAICAADVLSFPFVFIYILALFCEDLNHRGTEARSGPGERSWKSRRPRNRRPELPTSCHFPLFSYTFWLCSGDFGVAWTAVFAVRGPHQRLWKGRTGGQRPPTAAPDCLSFPFVFIYILALFWRFCGRQVEESRVATTLPGMSASHGPNISLGRSIAVSAKGAYRESAENKRGHSGITYLTGLKSLANPTKEL